MYQSIIEKASDALLPMAIAVGVWGAVHYAELTPRILKADLPIHYQNFDSELPLPAVTRNCFLDQVVGESIATARFEAMLYTASFKHVGKPFQEAMRELEDHLDKQCGLTVARQNIIAERERQRALALQEEARQRALAAAKQAEEEARKRQQQLMTELQYDPFHFLFKAMTEGL